MTIPPQFTSEGDLIKKKWGKNPAECPGATHDFSCQTNAICNFKSSEGFTIIIRTCFSTFPSAIQVETVSSSQLGGQLGPLSPHLDLCLVQPKNTPLQQNNRSGVLDIQSSNLTYNFPKWNNMYGQLQNTWKLVKAINYKIWKPRKRNWKNISHGFVHSKKLSDKFLHSCNISSTLQHGMIELCFLIVILENFRRTNMLLSNDSCIKKAKVQRNLSFYLKPERWREAED